MPFLNTTLSVTTKDCRNVKLIENLRYDDPIRGCIHVVPAGFESDGFSTPPEVWPIGFTPFGEGWFSSVLHDYLYRKTWLPKDVCDSLFLEAMESQGVEEKKRKLIYLGVKLGGQVAFDKDRKQLEQETKQ